ncbi:MAG: TetR/AcrR family transcriptional regulator [Actinomycetota bacterium]|nr:TetR/AcrR family transcriptional regulator [Actinomycetota bacterium]
MPRIWTDTISTHRGAVRDAILDTTAALATEAGAASVTMSRIAEETGIGRATLYKYFPDVQSILVAWHERLVTRHLTQLGAAKDCPGAAGQRLEAVLETYGLMCHQHHGHALAASLHGGEHVKLAQQRLGAFVRELVAEGVAEGSIRDDVPVGELATYCLHALGAASTLPSKAAVRRLVQLTLTSLRRPG